MVELTWVARPCADCGQEGRVRQEGHGSADQTTVLCAACLDTRVRRVREARPARKPGSGRKPKARD